MPTLTPPPSRVAIGPTCTGMRSIFFGPAAMPTMNVSAPAIERRATGAALKLLSLAKAHGLDHVR